MKGNLASLLERVGLSKATQLKRGTLWPSWEATEQHTFGAEKVHALYFDSRASETVVLEAAAEVRELLPKGTRYSAIVQASATVANDLAKLQVQSRAVGVSHYVNCFSAPSRASWGLLNPREI
jgi:hypothetical protein